MDLANLKSLTIPEGKVKYIKRNGVEIWNTKKLPDEYYEVEWIAAAAGAGAYIDLGFSFDTAAKIYLSLWFDSADSASTYPFGAAENSGALRCCLSCPYGAAGQQTLYGSTGSAFISAAVQKSVDSWSKNDLLMTLKKGLLKLQNLTVSQEQSNTTQAEYTMTSNLYLFAQNYNGSARVGTSRRQISRFAYYDKNDNLICNLIPCFRISDAVIGMYDTVRKIFLMNAGSGSFIKPPLVCADNLVGISTEADDVTIYNNGLGYKNGTRIRSGGAEGDDATASHTGFIPVKAGDIVRLCGYEASKVANANAINIYNSNHEVLGQITTSSSTYGYGFFQNTWKNYNWGLKNGVKEEKSGVWIWTVPPDASIAYMRVTGYTGGDGSSMIVTVNKEIY